MRLNVVLGCCLMVAAASADAISLDSAIAGAHRNPDNVARDTYRHPREVLEFFGLEPDMTVVEIWPGTGWWTEILAPVLREDGTYIAAGFATEAEGARQYQKDIQAGFRKMIESNPELYDEVVVTELSVPTHTDIAPSESADLVLTFRNVHNWLAAGNAEQMFRIFHDVLRPGGVLGVVEHRAPEGTDVETMKKSGYLTESLVIDLAQKAGFVLDAKSEVNANPKDTADHPAGVWTLPPSLRLCRQMPEGADQNACLERYRAIGESDRMTLRFKKPG